MPFNIQTDRIDIAKVWRRCVLTCHYIPIEKSWTNLSELKDFFIDNEHLLL